MHLLPIPKLMENWKELTKAQELLFFFSILDEKNYSELSGSLFKKKKKRKKGVFSL